MMTFSSSHYVPVLKLKRAEKGALALLAPGIATALTPLMEVVKLKDGAAVAAHLRTSFKNFDACAPRVSRYFLDTHEIDPAGRTAARTAFLEATRIGIPFVPVVGISRGQEVVDEAITAGATSGVGIRLTREELVAARIPNVLLRFLAQRALRPEDTDLLIDLGAVDDMLPTAVTRFATQFYGAVPFPARWRTLTLIGSAFAKSMGVVPTSNHRLIDRMEWLTWRDGFHVHRGTLPRLPTFGDCGIQHPSGVEGFDFRFMSPSAAVRYALANHWLLIKGVSAKTTSVSIQFPRLARSLITGALRGHYMGTSHCAGCEGAHRSASGAPKLGSPEAWRRLGTVHHLTVAVEQLRALAWP